VADFPHARQLCATPDADPVYLYTDCLVAIAPDKSINNGQPTPWKPEIRALSPA
jgi:protein-L-isoaspartate(D-aspartate) O-methyltransferase